MKLITFPEQVHWTETREFTIVNESNDEVKVRVIESPNGTNVFTELDNKWIMSEDEKLLNWIENDLVLEEMRLEFEQREETQIEKEHENTTYNDSAVVDNSESSTTN